jgi:hypothetical protein
MDRQKVQAVLDWPLPSFVRTMHSFLGLAGYYCWFIYDYGAIITPLTKLLCKGGFCWCPKAKSAFHALQHTLTTSPVLQLPGFDKLFVVDCDVLWVQHHPAPGHGASGLLQQVDRRAPR